MCNVSLDPYGKQIWKVGQDIHDADLTHVKTETPKVRWIVWYPTDRPESYD